MPIRGHLAVQGFPHLARMNQHRPMHQLVVLSIGWAIFFHPVPDPALTKLCHTQPFLAAEL